MADANRSDLTSARLPPFGHVVLLLIFWMIAVSHFDKWTSFLWMGDDLIIHHWFQAGAFASTLWQAIGEQPIEKYRPVFSLYLLLSMSAFGNDISLYTLTNAFIHALNSLLFFHIAFLVSKKRLAVALLSALAFCWSRFALVQVGVAMGAGEAIYLFFFLLSLLAFLQSMIAPRSAAKWLWLAVIASLLSVYTYERYILVPLLYAAAVWGVRDFRLMGYRTLAAISGSFLAIVLSNILLKTLVLHMAFLVGAGSSHIGIDVHRTVTWLVEGLITIFGFNYGPEYLNAVKITTLPIYYMFVAASLPLGVLLTAAAALSRREGRAAIRQEWRHPVLFVLLAGAVLVPPILTIRLEPRWLLAPFAMLLLCLSWGSTAASRRSLLAAIGPVALACVGSIALDQMLSKYFDRIYFVSATRFAADVKRQFIDGPEAKVDPIIMIAGQGQCRGTLGGQWFFQLYGGKERTVICADDAPAAAAARPTLDIPVFEYRPGVGFVRIAAQSTDTARSHVPMRPPGIVRVGPNPVDHGHPFNQQPNGQSAIWIELDRRADSDFVLALDGLPLATYVRDDILTAVIPDHFFEKPGTHWLRVRVTRGNISGESAPVAFVVR